MANGDIGVKGWRNYSTFSLFGSGSQRADRNTSILVDTLSGNLSVMANDWNLAGRIPCSLTRAYNHKDSTGGVDRPFGAGWFWQYDMCLTGNMAGGGNVTWKAADGSEYDFIFSAGPVWASPAGMFEYTLTFDSSPTPDRYFISVGTMKYTFEVNTSDSIARLIRIEDAFGNALNIVRVYSSSKPTAVIDKLQLEYDNGGVTTHDIVDFTYSGTKITMLRLLDTLDSGDYLDIHYTYSPTPIDGENRLIKAEPKFGSTALDMEVKYDYNTSAGLQMTKLFDTNGSKAGTPYSWQPSYNGSNQVATIVFPVESGTTGTVAYDYTGTAPSSWSHASPSAWRKVTDAEGNNWFFGQNADGTVKFALDPLWVNSTHESYTEYTYESHFSPATFQLESVKTPRPNAESGQLTTSFYYNSDRHLAAVVDPYGFCSWYVYGTRASYATSGTGATKKEVVGIFTPKPGTQAYDVADHTNSETTPPSLSTPVTVSSFVTSGSFIGVDYWYYVDGASASIKLARTVNDYTFATGTGKLTQLLSCSPENFGESTFTSYTLTSASACSKQEYNSTSGDLFKTWTPRQFMDSNQKYSQFTYDTVFGSVTRSANADGVYNNPTTPDATEYTYDATGTLVTKVAQPEDPGNQWVEYGYTSQWFRTTVMKPDIGPGGGWGIDPIVSVTTYDYNGNVSASYQADPGATPADWDGTAPGSGYEKISDVTYDRLNRVVLQNTYVDLSGTPATLESTFRYDLNGNLVRQRGPAYSAGGTKYSYNFTEYDAANRPVKVYNTLADAGTNFWPYPTDPASAFVLYLYDLAGNTIRAYDQLYDWPNDPDPYHYTDFSYDWGNRQILTSANYNNGGTPTARTSGQEFDATGQLYFSFDGTGYEMWPEYDLNGRQISLHRGSAGGDGDLRVFDYNGNLEYYYTYKDNVTDSGNYRWQYFYDRLDRRVNDARGWQAFPSVWVTGAFNTAATEFDLNGNLWKSYDKVNSGKFTERVYDDWQQLTLLKAPEVPNPAGGNIIYETENFYDVLGRRTSVDDHMNNATLFFYDQLGRVVLTTDAAMYDTIMAYDARGNRSVVTMSYGAVYNYVYDQQNRLDELQVAHDSTTDITSYTYNELGQQTQVDYPDGGQTLTAYDELNRRAITSVLLSGSDFLDTTYTYDLNDRVLVTTLPGGYELINTWDNLGNLTQLRQVLDPSPPDYADTVYTYDLDNRRATQALPNGMVTTWAYDWQTMQVAAVLQEIDTTSGHDITVSYTYNANGQPTVITDGNSNTWTKTYDAMRRMTSLMMPNTNTHAITYDGNSNIIKTIDFKGTTHHYFYDELNRMVEQGPNATVTTNTDKYHWNCCTRMYEYEDAFSTTASDIQYDQLNRVTDFTDTLGNLVQYEYDSMGRVTKITPAQGSGYRTEYSYNANGSLNDVEIFVGGTGETTTYTYDTTSGKLLQRNLPTVSSANLRTTYGYDDAGRLNSEIVTKQTGGGATNLYKTTYDYAFIAAGSGGGRSLLRTESVENSGWELNNKVLYEWNALEWMRLEQRWDRNVGGGTWVAKYDVNQEYDKRGNRTRYDKNVQGSTADYGVACDLSYSFDGSSLLTGITDANFAFYNCTVTCDANNNIATLDELVSLPGLPPKVNHLYTYFDVDALNRVTAHRTKHYVAGGTNAWMWAKRAHEYDGLGRLVRSTYKTWQDGSSEPAGTSLEHTYDKNGKHLQNYDGTSTYGEVWHWAGSDPMPETAHPLKSPNADTASVTAYNHGDNSTPQRRAFINPTPTEGDQRHLWGQGRPMAKDSSGGGSAWATGTTSQPTGFGFPPVESRVMYEGTVTTALGRATDAREKGRLGIFGSGLSYAGGSGRMTSEAIGRDVNPRSRGWKFLRCRVAELWKH